MATATHPRSQVENRLIAVQASKTRAHVVCGMRGLHRLRWLISLLCMLALLASPSARASSDAPHISQLHHTAWTVKEGAPGQITALAQTTDGFLWLATQHGLFRFDGISFEQYKPPGAATFPASSVAALYAPASGGLWVGFRYGVASFLHDGRLTNYGEAEGLPTGTVYGFAQDADGVVWAATYQGLARLDAGRWHAVGAASGYPGKQARAVFVDRDGTLWVASEDSLACLPRGGDRFTTLAATVGRISGIAQATDGSIWIAEADGGVRPVQGADGEVSTRAGIALPSAGLLFDRNGGLWATTLGDGVRRVRDPLLLGQPAVAGTPGAIEVFGKRDGLSADYLLPVLEDREGNIWVGTSRGLDRFRQANLVPAEFPDGAYDFTLVAGDAGDAGAIWAGTRNRGLMRLQDQRITTIALASQVTAAYRAPGGTIWLGGPTGLWTMQANTPVPVTQLPAGTQYSGVQAITETADGALLVSLNTPGVQRWKDGAWTRLPDDPAMPDGSSPLSLLTDARGRTWMGFARNEITLIEDGRSRRIGARDGLEVGNVTALLQGARHVWIGGERGLAYSDGRTVHTLRAPAGDPFRGISGALLAANGDLWLNGTRGVVQVAAEELTRVLADPTHRVRYALFDFLDGLPGTPAQFRPIPTAVQGSDGRLWFATTSGVVSVDPTRIVRNPLPPPVVIRSLRAGDKVHDIGATRLQLPAQADDLQIDYTALSLSIPERVRFRYRLEGFDDAWQDVGTRRVAFYNHPGPGHYRFRVIAANNDGVWNDTGASIAFSIAPRFFQTWWFRALCVLAGLHLLWLLWLLRVRALGRQIRTRLHERHMERERIARELHDTLLQSIQGLILRFQAVADTIPASEPTRQDMEKALDRADQVLVEGRNRVLDLRASTLYPGSLAEVFAKVAEELSRDHSADFRMASLGIEQAIDPIVRDEICGIGREALLNAYHHADARTIALEIVYSRDELRVRVVDDGRGVDAKVLEDGGRAGHWGFSGMRERAARIGGRLSIVSHPGAGTEVELRIPAAAAYRPQRAGLRWPWLKRRLGRGRRG